MDFLRYTRDLNIRLAQLNNVDLGYELGENKASSGVPRASLESLRLISASPSLLALYEHVGSVSAPDLWNGIFLLPAEDAHAKHGRTLPSSWRKPNGDTASVFVFGTDGGGNMLSIDDRETVWFLPLGEMRNGVYHEGKRAVTRLGTMEEFLHALLKDIEKFVEGDREHPFIGRLMST